jgi:hypothetical protein
MAWNRLTDLPKLTIDFSDIPLATKESKLSIPIKARDKEFDLHRVNIFLNDVPANGLKGFDISQNMDTEFNGEIEVELSAGINEIEISVQNELGIESIPEVFQVKYEKEYFKPELYILSIGISDYADSRYNLSFAAKDATDLVKALEKSSAYEAIHSKSLLNSNATKNSILEAKKWLSNAKIDDRVIVFIAGHGVLDKDYNYYFATHDMEFNDPSKGGLAYEQLQEILNDLSCRNKLLIMDTCHSGELDSNDIQKSEESQTTKGSVSFRSTGKLIQLKENSFGLENTLELSKTLFSDLKKGTGSTVISAAGGTEFALEGVNSENGLFTSCFLEGIRTRRADLDRNRKYLVSEFQSYVSERVIELSNGEQVPTSREENIKNDFQIY